MKKIYSFIRKFFQVCGINISRYRPSSSFSTQILSALDLSQINIIFDIGANEGQFSDDIYQQGYSGKVISFEPLSAARNNLIKLASQVPMWTVHEQCAIGDYDGEAKINVSKNLVSSSLLPMLDSHVNAATDSSYFDSEVVPIYTLDKIADLYLNADSKLFLKIDTQGYELQILNGASKCLKRASGVLCELSLVKLYEGQHLWRDIIDRLEAEGFMLWALREGFTDPNSGQTLQMDGLFLRHDFF